MKLFIWQQFSSNHSAHFTVVGRFLTEEEALQATRRFRDILARVHAWRMLPENYERQEQNDYVDGEEKPLPVEREIIEEVGIELYPGSLLAIDWIAGEPEERVQQIFTDVFVSVEFETWDQPNTIIELMKHFGGKTQSQYTFGNVICVHLTATFADESQAEKIFNEVNTYFVKRSAYLNPWKRTNEYESISAWGTIKRQGMTVMVGCEFFRLDPGLRFMVEWLNKMGAVSISYDLSECHPLD